MSRTRRWRRLDVPAVEDFSEDGRTFQGRVGVQEALPWSVDDRVTFDDGWVTRSAEISVQHPEGPRGLELRREVSGRWFAGSRELAACRGSLDVDLEVTPSTNASAIRRLGLAIGQSAELTATWICFPQLSIEPLPQRYTRLSDGTYLYESLRDGAVVFHARIEVDATGLVERYERFFERVEAPGPG